MKSESGWKRVQDDVRVMRNELAPLSVKFLAQHNAGKGGILNQILSGTALTVLLEKEEVEFSSYLDSIEQLVPLF